MKIIGWDTETYKGFVKVLTNSEGQFLESSDTIELLNFLFFNSKADYNVFFNIGYDLGSILKPYIIENGEKLHNEFYQKINAKEIKISDKEEEEGYYFKVENYEIRFLNDKMFYLKKGKTRKFFWDTSNFYKSGFGHLSLDKASELYLGKRKNAEELGIDRRKIGEEEGYYEKHRELIIKYSIYDSILTKELFERSINSYNNLGFKFPKKPFSEASIFKEYLNDKWDEEIKIAKELISSPYFVYFHNAYRGGLFQTWKVGFYKDVYDIDINSAYPYSLANMPSLRYGFKIVEDDLDDAYYKFYKIRASPNRFLPIKNNLRLIYGNSKNKFTFYITSKDKEILDLYHYPYQIENVISIKLKKEVPLLPEINQWYKRKFEIKEKYGSQSVEYYNIKILINSGYGVFAQSYPTFTKFTNFVYASYITANTRFRIAQLINELQNQGDNIIAIATDGILLKKNSDKGIQYLYDNNYIGKNMGQLDISYYDDAVQYANGIYLLRRYNNGELKYILKKRGFEMLKYEDLFRNEREIVFKQYKPMKMISAIVQKKFNELNDFILQEKVFSPFISWIGTNPSFANRIFDWNISDFMYRSIDVNELNIDDYPFLIRKIQEG